MSDDRLIDCTRCDWRGPTSETADHASDTDHPLCWTCPPRAPRFLNRLERQTCGRCLNRARVLLAGVVHMYLELPLHARALRAVGLGRAAGGSDGPPLPGGAALVLLAAGSRGRSDNSETRRASDPPSIPYELATWARDWQETRDEVEPLGHRATITALKAAGYLERRMTWASDEHPAFDSFLTDLRHIHHVLERATGRDLPTQRANADCFDCGGRLVRHADPKTGLLDDAPVECEDCHELYDGARYQLALRAAYMERVEGWVLLTDASRIIGVKVDTLHKWAERQRIRSDVRPDDGRRVVWWPDVRERQQQLEEARRRRQEQQQKRQAQEAS